MKFTSLVSVHVVTLWRLLAVESRAEEKGGVVEEEMRIRLERRDEGCAPFSLGEDALA